MTKQSVIWVKCNGEAHSNPFIDHCIGCMPYWEDYPECPICRTKVKISKRKSFAFYCPNCRKFLIDTGVKDEQQ
jgi:hypothetical protein